MGYAKDRFAGEELQKANPDLYAQYRAETPSKFLVFDKVHGLDGRKLGEVKTALADLRKADPKAGIDQLPPNQKTVAEADMAGDRHTSKADSGIPAIMAAICLVILLYCRSIGGYKPVHIVGTGDNTKEE